MANLTSKTPFDGLLPLTHGTVTLSEVTHDTITWIAPSKSPSKTLEKQIGAPFPAPNRASGPAVWFGPGQALVLGRTLKPVAGVAQSDQSSAFACCTLQGPNARDVLSRLVPIDLRDSAFAPGHAARTLLGHMNCTLIRRDPETYEIMVFRSMAQTAVHEIERAMAMVCARETSV